MGLVASLLQPMSTRISASRPATPRPRTTQPSSTSLTPRLNQYSMLSSVASTSFDPPTRVLAFRFSVSMTPHLLRIYCPTLLPTAFAAPGADRSPASSPGPLHDTPPCVRRHPLSCPPGRPACPAS